MTVHTGILLLTSERPGLIQIIFPLPLKGWLLMFYTSFIKVPISSFHTAHSSELYESSHTHVTQRTLPALWIWYVKFTFHLERITKCVLGQSGHRWARVALHVFLENLTETRFQPSWDQNQISLTLIQSNQVLYFFPERVITLSAISKPAA